MKILVLILPLVLSSCISIVNTAPRHRNKKKRPQMVRLHDSKVDCDEETLDAHDRDLCDLMHGRKK